MKEEKLIFKIISFNFFPKTNDINDCNALLENGEIIRVDPFVGCAFNYENSDNLLNHWWESEGHWHESLENNCPLAF